MNFKNFLIIVIGLMSLTSCSSTDTASAPINEALSQQEISAGIFTPEVMLKMGRISQSQVSPDGKSVAYVVTRYSVTQNNSFSTIYVLDIQTKQKRELNPFGTSIYGPRWSQDSKKIFFMASKDGEEQGFEMDLEAKNVRQLTDVKGGIEGFLVSPNEAHLCYIKAVHVKDILSKDIYKDMDKSQARIYDDLMARHWNYWDEGKYHHIFLKSLLKEREDVDITGSDACWDTPMAPYFDLDEISWSPLSNAIAYTCKPLTGTEYATSTDSDIYIYSIKDNTTKNLTKFHAQYGQMYRFEGYDRYPVFSPQGNRIAFISQATPGYESDIQRIFVHDEFLRNLSFFTRNFDHSAECTRWIDEDNMIFISPIEGTRQLCRKSLQIAGIDIITKGNHDITSFSYSKGTCVAEVTTLSSAVELYKIDIVSGFMEPLTYENQEIYSNIRMGHVEKRMITTTDNKKMLTWVIFPPEFDPSKKYPTLLYCQGGPQDVISQSWSYRWNFQLMAAQGYVVVAPNRRGTPSFGTEWLYQISGDYSGQNIKDYLSAIDQISKESWCDTEHLGCVGASYGGYSVFFLAGNHEKRFKAFIAHCGIFNLESMYGETEEVFFTQHDLGGPYWDKKNAVAVRSFQNSPHRFVDRWDTPILIITGENDFRIPYTQSLQAFTAARLRGVDARLLEFSNEAHQVFKPQNCIVWNREFFGWLDKYLK